MELYQKDIDINNKYWICLNNFENLALFNPFIIIWKHILTAFVTYVEIYKKRYIE